MAMALGLVCLGFASSLAAADGAQKPAARAVTARSATLPISLLDVMRASVDTKYRPQAPSDGVSRYPFYPKRELPK
jgi:hypothetical protein